MGQIELWICLGLALFVVFLPFLVWAVLRPLLKWHDERRRRLKELQGFEVKLTEVNSVKEKRENDHG
jgi:hypothetical protein